MSSEVHKRKRTKNLALLALVLAWCALIWLVTMAKIAHGAEIPRGAFLEARKSHQAGMDNGAAGYQERGAAHQSGMDNAKEGMKTAGSAHVDSMNDTRSRWTADWDSKAPARDQRKAEMDSQRAAHQQALDPKPQQWWNEWHLNE